MQFYLMKFNVCDSNRLYYQIILFCYQNRTPINLPINLLNNLSRFSVRTRLWTRPTILALDTPKIHQSTTISISYKLKLGDYVNKFALYTTYNFANYNRVLLKTPSKINFGNLYHKFIIYWLNHSTNTYYFNIHLSNYLQQYFINPVYNSVLLTLLNLNSVNPLFTQNTCIDLVNLTHNIQYI